MSSMPTPSVLDSAEQSPASSLLRHFAIALAIGFAVLWLATLADRRLLNPDEARYAEISREMLVTGNWITPRLNDLKYFEKPPLQYWATAVAYKAFGPTEFAARLWCGLTGLASILLVGWAGARWFGRNAGILAACVLASSLMHFALGHTNTLDMGVAFFLFASVVAFIRAQQAPINSQTERNFMLLAWSAAALAMLSKGVIAVALPGLTLIVYSIVQRDVQIWKRLHIVSGLLLFLGLASPWFVAVSIANPEYVKFFFLHEHFERFLTDVHERVEPWWYFLPLLFAGALPWTSFAVAAFINSWRTKKAETPGINIHRFLIVWIGVITVFFSLSHSKVAPYILPVYPAIALLCGDYLMHATPQALRRHAIGIALLWAAVCVYLLLASPSVRIVPPEQLPAVLRFAAAAFAIASFGAVAAVSVLSIGIRGSTNAQQTRLMAMVALAASAFLAFSILIKQADAASKTRSGYAMAEQLRDHQTASTPFFSIWTFDPGLAFYLQRTMTMMDYYGELVFGQKQEPEKALPDLPTFMQVWHDAPAGAVAVMPHTTFVELTEARLPMELIAKNSRLIAIKKPQ
jgi:4-amino-4-deoxy-L-arabinose transferase-like glycosyltransferase